MLSHQRASDQHLRAILYIDGDAVAARLLTIEIFAWEPIDCEILFLRAHHEPQNGERTEVIVRAVRELRLTVAEAEVAAPGEVHPPLAVVNRVLRAEPLQMELDRVVALCVHVREGGARVDEGYLVRIAAIHNMVVNRNTSEGYLEIIVGVEHFDPLHIVVRLTVPLQVARLVVASNLEVAAVFAEAHGNLAFFDDTLLLHHIVYGLESIQIHARSLRAQPEDPISLLTIKVLCFSMHASEGIFKRIDIYLRVFSEIQRVLSHVAFISTALSVPLIESTPVLLSTSTIDCSAVVEPEVVRSRALIEVINV